MAVKAKKLINVLEGENDIEKVKNVISFYRVPFTIDKACEQFNLETDRSQCTLYGHNGEIFIGANRAIIMRTDNELLEDKHFKRPATLDDLIDNCIDAGIKLYWREAPSCLQ